MIHLKYYAVYIAEGKKISIDELEAGTEVTYQKNDGTTAIKRISRIDPEKQIIYFTDNGMHEFSKPLSQIVSITAKA